MRVLLCKNRGKNVRGREGGASGGIDCAKISFRRVITAHTVRSSCVRNQYNTTLLCRYDRSGAATTTAVGGVKKKRKDFENSCGKQN